MDGPVNPARLRAALDATPAPLAGDDSDYRMALVVGRAFLARAKTGEPTLLIPLPSAPAAAGRRGGGFALNGVERVVFRTDDRQWEQAAATLSCTDSSLVDSFMVLVTDFSARLANITSLDWRSVLAWVEEWQVLLARRLAMDTERQLGLWGELWVIDRASRPDVLVAGWRGPDRDPTDFFVDGVGVEVKTSRRAHVHHVSRRQVNRPVGSQAAYVLSLWAGIDPVRGTTLPDLIDGLSRRVADAPSLLRRVAALGYAPADRSDYTTKFVLLESPLWFLADDVPQIREVDPGITELRYVVTLDNEKALAPAMAEETWLRFLGSVPLL